MECENCDVEMKKVDNRFSMTRDSRREYLCPECGAFKERDRHDGR